MQAIQNAEKSPEVDERAPDLEKASSCQDGTTTTVGSGVDDAGFRRQLGKRQIMMMTFGAGIGTGLWVGTGTALKYAGPGGIAVAYTIVAFIVYLQYTSVGEMSTYRPVHGGFIRQQKEYVDSAFAFATGVNFWFQWVMIIPAEITAAVSVLQFWPETSVVPLAAYITMFLAVMVVGNVFSVRVYGHIEYWMSWIKILAIFAMIFFLFIMASGGIAATHGPLVFHYWKTPGAFTNGIKGIAKAFVQAGFSFGGGEHIAIIAGEAKKPRKTIKATVYPVFWRMFAFFVLNIWLRAKQGWLAHVLNAFIFLTVISCGITSVYIASRSLTAMSDIKLIHPIFGRKDKAGRPWLSLGISTLIGGGLCYLNTNSTTSDVYSWFSSLVAIAAFFQWFSIFVCHCFFREAQNISYKSLPFKAPLAPWLPMVGIIVVFFILGCEFYLSVSPFGEKGSAKTFFATYLGAPLFVFDFVAYKLWYKTKFVKPSDVDFSEAFAFDEQDRLEAELAAQNGDVHEKGWNVWQKVKNLVFG
ncbi:hypothetical protein M409DRAFT_28121 [Zasmidium cellare ATCC 36951]|uniref:Amino acid permease/ SLC12A domain-containing protein n=1 Tax=Zasmidium cellare ATCC 36951 TaxID=1080233 RepID=A0A6A6C2N1_ZASCE|nr:uncharacterized protein M409DRAFT_28121 [Zasmidium cellare ATCC 36951]KAF2161387.1 hypothetical protein M409DRAFT_28121 [Zasmidium cellare ATCC 36951]